MVMWGGEDWTKARRVTKARMLLAPAVRGASGVWADLGCGDGVFSYLLGEALAPGSQLYAVDKAPGVLRQLTRNLAGRCRNITLHPTQADFTQPLALPPLDGIVLANALHFVEIKTPVLEQLALLLKPSACLVVIEYNTNQGNYAVPYPLDATVFLSLAATVGLHNAKIVALAPSSFLGEMYTGVAFAAHGCR